MELSDVRFAELTKRKGRASISYPVIGDVNDVAVTISHRDAPVISVTVNDRYI